MHRSKISWCDYSGGYANFVRRGKKEGECEVSPACRNCYVKRCWQMNPEKWPDETTWYPEKLAQLLRCRPTPGSTPYRRGPGSRPTVFLCDTGDLFHHRVPADFIFSALDTIYSREDIDWQILTKRHERAHHIIHEWLARRELLQLPAWMWMMFTVENQEWFNRRMPYLIHIPAAIRGLSLEPLLGPVDVVGSGWWDWRYTYSYYKHAFPDAGPPLDWLVVGGESDRVDPAPMQPEWVRDLLDQSKRAGIAFVLKQWGDYVPQSDIGRERFIAAGWDPEQFRGGNTIDGSIYTEFPEVKDIPASI